MEFFIYAIAVTLAIYLYFLESKSSLISFILISVSLFILSIYRVYSLRTDFISNINSSIINANLQISDLYLNIFDYSMISIYLLVSILILLSSIFLLNKKNISIFYIFVLGIIMICIPLYTYLYARDFDIYSVHISSYLFRSASYQCLLLQVPFLIKKIFNYFKYTTPFFSHPSPVR